MKIQEKVCEIRLSQELSNAEKRDRLPALIPAEAYKIEGLNQAIPGTAEAIARSH
jgi:hypothetical protein